MRRSVIALMCIFLFSAGANATDLRLYFSKQGDTSGIPPEWTAASTATYGPGDSKIYVWGATEKTGTVWDIWVGFGAKVDRQVTAGTAYNPEDPDTEFLRWTSADLIWDADGVKCVALMDDGLGSMFDPLMVPGTDQRHFLIAELSFPTTSTYDVFLMINFFGMARKGGDQDTDLIYLGFGDAGLISAQYDTKTALPDLHVVPEPSSLALLGLALLALYRR